MSPVPTVTRVREADRTVRPLPDPPADAYLGMAMEMVVDWQMPSDMERKN